MPQSSPLPPPINYFSQTELKKEPDWDSVYAFPPQILPDPPALCLCLKISASTIPCVSALASLHFSHIGSCTEPLSNASMLSLSNYRIAVSPTSPTKSKQLPSRFSYLDLLLVILCLFLLATAVSVSRLSLCTSDM